MWIISPYRRTNHTITYTYCKCQKLNTYPSKPNLFKHAVKYKHSATHIFSKRVAMYFLIFRKENGTDNKLPKTFALATIKYYIFEHNNFSILSATISILEMYKIIINKNYQQELSITAKILFLRHFYRPFFR